MSRRAVRVWPIACLVAAMLVVAPAAEDTASTYDIENFLTKPAAGSPWLPDFGVDLVPAVLVDSQNGLMTLAGSGGGRLWARLSLPAGWTLHARVGDTVSYTHLEAGATSGQWENSVDLSSLYLRMDGERSGASLTVGRADFVLGSGLVMAGPADGARIGLANTVYRAQLFGLYTGWLHPDVLAWQLGTADDGSAESRLAGGFSAGLNLAGHELSLLGLYQTDTASTGTELYTSWYTGLSLGGHLAGGTYLLEGWLEEGQSPFGNSVAGIRAFAAVADYYLMLPLPFLPGARVSYAVASGDPDRTAADGAAGNTAGQDNGFQAFGYLDLGAALRPAFSNIQVLRVSLSAAPLGPLAPGTPLSRSRLETTYRYYLKYRAVGGIGTGEATLPSLDLGHGIDARMSVSPWNDLTIFASGGVFLPGAAWWSDEPIRWSVSGGISLSL